jgi:hypothetical protein
MVSCLQDHIFYTVSLYKNVSGIKLDIIRRCLPNEMLMLCKMARFIFWIALVCLNRNDPHICHTELCLPRHFGVECVTRTKCS